MFELADSGSSGDLPLLCPPLSSPRSLSLSLILPPSPSLSLTFSTCYATLLCHAALAAQVCGHVGTRKRTPPSQRLHLSTFLFLLSQPARALPLPLPLSRCASSSTPFHRRSPLPFLFFFSFLFALRIPRLASSWTSQLSPSPSLSRSGRGTGRTERSERGRREHFSFLFPEAPPRTYLCPYTCAGAYCHAQWLGRDAAKVHRSRRSLLFYLQPLRLAQMTRVTL